MNKILAILTFTLLLAATTFAADNCNPCIYGDWVKINAASFSVTVTSQGRDAGCKDAPLDVPFSVSFTDGTKERYCTSCGETNTGTFSYSITDISYTYENLDTGDDSGSGTLETSSTNLTFVPVSPGPYKVTITVTAETEFDDDAHAESGDETYRVECCDCQSMGTCSADEEGPDGPDKGAASSFGMIQPKLKSVYVNLGLGAKALTAKPAGFLRIHEQLPSAMLATPQCLKWIGLPDDTEVIRDISSNLRQVRVPQGLVDVVTIDSLKYEIRFYLNPGTKDQNGFYQPSGSPVATTEISNPDATGNTWNRLKVKTTRGSTVDISEYEWTEAVGQLPAFWKLKSGGDDQGNYLRTEEITKSITVTTIDGLSVTNRTETRELYGKNAQNEDVLVSKVSTTYRLFTWGEGLVEEVVDPDGAKLTNTYTYSATGIRVQEVRPDGSWTWNLYDAENRLFLRYQGFLNQAPTTNASLCRSWEYDFTALTNSGDYGTVKPRQPRRIIERLLGHEIGRTYFVVLAGETRRIQCQTPEALATASDNLVTITTTHTSGAFKDQVKSIENPDGTMAFYEYTTNSVGTMQTNIVTQGQPNAQKTAIVDGIKTITVLGSLGEMLTSTNLDISTGLVTAGRSNSNFDDFRRPQRVDYFDGTYELFTYSCCGLETHTDRQGTQTTYGYDLLKRLHSTMRDGITTITDRDAAGRVIKVSRQASSGTIVQRETTYDLAGRPVAEYSVLNGITAFAHQVDAQNQRIRTTTYTNGATRVETRAQDGSLLKLTGTAVAPMRYDYTVEQDGTPWRVCTKTIKLASDGTDTQEWTKTYSDMLGRSYKTVYPDAAYTQSFFNNAGQLWKTRDPDGIAMLYQYNAKGEREYSVMDSNRNDQIDWAGLDRITRVVNDVVTSHDVTVLRTRTYAWTNSGENISQLVSTKEQAVQTNASWSTTYGLTRHTWSTLFGNGVVITTNLAPDLSYTVTRQDHGRMTGTTNFSATPAILGYSTVEYDAHGRQWKVTDARNGTTTYTYNDADQISSVTTPRPAQNQDPQVTTTHYDAMGRPWKVVMPDSQILTNTYYLNGQIQRNYGARTYPVEYTYDSQGRMTAMKTWQSFNLLNPTDAATTTWTYDPQRGWLSAKRYQDKTTGQPEAIGTDYTYTEAGRLKTRTWARGATRIKVIYNYTQAGDLRAFTYNDGRTPGTSIYPDRLGRQIKVVRNSITTTLAYNEAGQPLYENYSGGSLGGLTISNRYDSLFRRVTNGLWNGTTWLVQATNSFDEAGRLAVVGDPLNEVSAGYSYLANSPLIEYTYFTNGSSRVMTTSRTYDNLNRLTTIETLNTQPATINAHTYTYNAANQRTNATEASTDYWDYAYDDLGQVTSGKKYNSEGTPVAGRQFEYAFDTIGNRDSTVANGTSADYTANLQNQYATRVSGGATETFTHDLDGNLSTDSLWSYTWDGENRLVEMVSQSSVPDGEKRKLKFEYDYRGRRIGKQVFVYNNGYPAQPTSEERFVYDGWNLLAVLTPNSQLLSSFTWGLDLSGSLQGAGGVGGLLFTRSTLNNPVVTHCVSYDGNGNVMALVNAADGTVAGSYEYGPFGETVSVTGTPAVNHALRFSTKYQDAETGYLYYGYRSYNPLTGRWLSRDPIGEWGGVNLYGFVCNNVLCYVDIYGLQAAQCTRTLVIGHLSSTGLEELNTFLGANPNNGIGVNAPKITFLTCGSDYLNSLLNPNNQLPLPPDIANLALNEKLSPQDIQKLNIIKSKMKYLMNLTPATSKNTHYADFSPVEGLRAFAYVMDTAQKDCAKASCCAFKITVKCHSDIKDAIDIHLKAFKGVPTMIPEGITENPCGKTYEISCM